LSLVGPGLHRRSRGRATRHTHYSGSSYDECLSNYQSQVSDIAIESPTSASGISSALA
jgi:hypothetical protein